MLHLRLKTVSLVLLFALLTMGVSAQPKGRGGEVSPEKMAEQRTERLSKELGLTEEQKSEVYAINLKYTEQRGGEKREKPKDGEGEKGERPDREEMQKKMQKQQEACSKEVMAVLDEEQKAKYAEMLKKQKDNPKERKERK